MIYIHILWNYPEAVSLRRNEVKMVCLHKNPVSRFENRVLCFLTFD